jgi:hypothetical protein
VLPPHRSVAVNMILIENMAIFVVTVPNPKNKK